MQSFTPLSDSRLITNKLLICYLPFFFNFFLLSYNNLIKRSFPRRRKFRRLLFKELKNNSNVCLNFRSKKIKHLKTFKFILSLTSSVLFFTFDFYIVFFFTSRALRFTLKIYKFLFKSSWKFSKKKKKTLRKRFFSFKRSKRHRIHRFLKTYRFKKEIFKIKTLFGSKLMFVTNLQDVMTFNKIFISGLSTKFILLFSMLLANKFRKFLPKLIHILQLFYNFNTSLYFTKYITEFKKWSNVIPFFYLPQKIKSLVKSKTSQLTHFDYLLYLRQMMGGFLESLCQKKIFLKISTKLRIKGKIKKGLLFLYKKHRNYQNSIGRGFFFNEMLFVCWYALFTKDLQFLMG